MKKLHIYCLTSMLLLGVFFVGCGQGSLTTKEATLGKQANSVNDSKTKVEVPDSVNHEAEIVSKDSIYPSEYEDTQGLERYLKIREGVYVYSKSYSGRSYEDELSRLDFFNEKGEKISEFDIRKNNPYNKEAIPNLVAENYQAYVYNSFVSKSESEGKTEYSPKQYMTFSQRPDAEQGHLPVIGYHLLGSSHEGFISDWKFTAVCLDEKGNILRKFEDLDIDPYEFCVSENKKFFCVAYGGLRGENLTRLRNNGFRIYEIETGELVYEVNEDSKHGIFGPSPDNLSVNHFYGSFSITGNDFSNDRSMIFNKIDFNLRLIYRKKVSYKDGKLIKGADKEGFIMNDPKTGKKWKLYYEKDFTIEKF